MLKILVWDEVYYTWVDRELNLPDDCRDAILINRVLTADNCECTVEEVLENETSVGYPAWKIEKITDTGNLLIIETRSDDNYYCIILVNYLDQD